MHGDIVTSEQLCKIWQNYTNTPTIHHGRMAKKPMTALITGLRTLRWTLTRWELITTHDGREVHLSICPPAMLKQVATQAYTCTLVTKFETKLTNHHPDHYDTAHAIRRTNIEQEGTHHQEQIPPGPYKSH
jgi:hypothetical protein